MTTRSYQTITVDDDDGDAENSTSNLKHLLTDDVTDHPELSVAVDQVEYHHHTHHLNV
jgi:hypothetical protein